MMEMYVMISYSCQELFTVSNYMINIFDYIKIKLFEIWLFSAAQNNVNMLPY